MMQYHPFPLQTASSYGPSRGSMMAQSLDSTKGEAWVWFVALLLMYSRPPRRQLSNRLPREDEDRREVGGKEEKKKKDGEGIEKLEIVIYSEWGVVSYVY